MKAIAVNFIVLATILTYTAKAQTLEDIASFEKQHQNCLDQGIAMINCSSTYYSQMDSLLNLSYNNLRKNLDEKGKAVLKKEELEWLKKRDLHHKAMVKETKKDLSITTADEIGEDYYMVLYDKDADFMEERVIALIKRLHK